MPEMVKESIKQSAIDNRTCYIIDEVVPSIREAIIEKEKLQDQQNMARQLQW